MTKRSPLAGLLLCLSLLSFAVPGLAQAEREDPLARMEREGWTAVQKGVLQRQPEPGEVESYVFGSAGFTWKLQDLQSQLQVLRREHAANPTSELRRAMASHRQMIASTRRMIERARAAEAAGKSSYELPYDCVFGFGFDAEAGPKVNVRGTWAAASADHFDGGWGCGYQGEVYAYAFAKATVNGAPTTMTVTDGPRTGVSVNASAEAHRSGGPDCESYAYSSVTTNAISPTSYSRSKSNLSCPAASAPAPLQVSVSGWSPDGDLIREGQCVTVHWTANVSGGTPFYTPGFYRDGVLLRTGTSYTEPFCFDRYNEETTFREEGSTTITVQVTDSAGQSKSATGEVWFTFRWWVD